MPETENHNKEKLKEITASIETGIQELFKSEKYQQYLRTMSRFHRYSVNNTMLIYMQKPDATLVAGFNKWRDNFGRNVMKGEKGIRIIAPSPYKKRIEEAKLDPDTRLPMLDADGKVIMEKKEIQIPMFKPVIVFDVSQTSGKPLPQLASDLAGNIQNYAAFMEALERSSPVPIALKELDQGIDGYFDQVKGTITLRSGMSEVQTVSAAIHEIAHSMLHDNKHQQEVPVGSENAASAKKKDRRTEEIEAESVSYAVCAYYGIATGENSFGYIASWSKDKELSELRASLETINKAASELITDIDRNYVQIMNERAAELEDAKAPFEETIPLEEKDRPYHQSNTDRHMVPISKEQAVELFERDVPVYMIYPDGKEAMAFDVDEICSFDGLVGISREDWETMKIVLAPVMDKPDYEKVFRGSEKDAYLLFQLKETPELAELRFESFEYLQKNNLTVKPENYESVYAGMLPAGKEQGETLSDLYTKFNIDHPQGFYGHSMSVSDIIVLRQQGQISSHYVDSWGFKELPHFMLENYLKNAEMAVEDDYGMIDGILNNGQKSDVSSKELPDEERPSVLEKLRSFNQNRPREITNNTAPKRNTEKEMWR